MAWAPSRISLGWGMAAVIEAWQVALGRCDGKMVLPLPAGYLRGARRACSGNIMPLSKRELLALDWQGFKAFNHFKPFTSKR